jgi:hypothetical protein
MISHLETIIPEESLKLIELIALALVAPRIGLIHFARGHRNRKDKPPPRRKHSANFPDAGSIVRQVLKHLK